MNVWDLAVGDPAEYASIEGISTSSIPRDVVLRLSYSNESFYAQDMVKFSVVNVELIPKSTNVCWTDAIQVEILTTNRFSPNGILWTGTNGLAVVSTNNEKLVFTPTNSIPTNYLIKAEVVGLATCYDSATVTVYRVDLDPSSTNVCWNSTNRIEILATNSYAPNGIAWSGTNGLAVVSANSTNLVFTPTNSFVTNYSVRAAAVGFTNCSDVCEVTVLKVELTNIKFNHDTSSSASDALNIRQDYGNAYDISNGEWGKCGTNIPVCYTTNKAVTIKARFTVQPASITNADIWAVSMGSAGSLGDVIRTNVTFSGGVSSPEYVTFQVSGNTPTSIKKTSTDVWQWKMENVNGMASAACDMNTSGVHTVYTIFNEPTTPWVNTAGSQRNAWKVALDFAVVICNSEGKATEDDAMDVITTHLYTIPYTGASQWLTFGGDFSYSGYMTMTSANCLDSAVGLDTTGSLMGMDMAARRRTEFFNYNFHCFVKKGTYVYDSCSAMWMCIIKMDYAAYINTGTPGPGSTESDETYPIE